MRISTKATVPINAYVHDSGVQGLPYRIHIQDHPVQAEGLKHAPDGELGQGRAPGTAVGVVAVWAANDHGQTC